MDNVDVFVDLKDCSRWSATTIDAGAPGQVEAGDGGVAVTVDACGERVEAGEVVALLLSPSSGTTDRSSVSVRLLRLRPRPVGSRRESSRGRA
ncbi:hypothetical protein AB0958_20360 [Streptomyces sp. NPDC006655]|uniref:hypothetical protein n=1 Tax=Streptomyces sp. NPDC006655 TaxID=3156898 RepID=UPI00345272F1